MTLPPQREDVAWKKTTKKNREKQKKTEEHHNEEKDNNGRFKAKCGMNKTSPTKHRKKNTSNH